LGNYPAFGFIQECYRSLGSLTHGAQLSKFRIHSRPLHHKTSNNKVIYNNQSTSSDSSRSEGIDKVLRMSSQIDPLTQILATLTDLQQQNALLNQKVSNASTPLLMIH